MPEWLTMPEAKLGASILSGLRELRIVPYLRQKMRRRWDVDFTVDIIRTIKNWPSVLLESLLNKLQPHTYVLRNGVRYQVRPGTADRDVILEVWNDECYTPRGFEISPEDTVVDVGAHIGVFSVLASRLAKNGHICSVEPVPANFEMLTQNLDANSVKNAVAINKAISDRRGAAEIFLSGGNTGGHSLFPGFSGESAPSSIRVETMSLADLMAECRISKIDFLKMDCEGGEYAILYPCLDSILGSIGKISMEYHDVDFDRKNGKALKEFLETKGFKVEMLLGSRKMLYGVRMDKS